MYMYGVGGYNKEQYIFLRWSSRDFFPLAFMFNGGSSSAITIHPIDTKICMYSHHY